MIWSGESETFGQPFFPEARSDGEGDALSAGLGDGLSVSDGDSTGVGVGEPFFRFDLLFGVGDGVGEAFFGLGDVSGDGVGVAFFFRCLRLGVGDGSKAFLIFVPNDSCAASAARVVPNAIATIRRQRNSVW
jgi:hypothetical protein